MRSKLRFIPLFLILIFFQQCSSPTSQRQASNEILSSTDEFKTYWYSGIAEMSSYKLEQARYGEVREGKAMLIFVTEDFSKSKEVKLDDPDKVADDKVGILKMNFTKNFVTGIYPYSMMLSVFSPIDRNALPHSLKVSMSAQEWCGHVFSQLNLDGVKYDFTGHSYFEKEGEERNSLTVALLEDELWTMIRLDPQNLPVGEVEIIPGLFFSRLRHTPLKNLKGNLSKQEKNGDVEYSINLPEQERTLIIRYQKNFPHAILGWTESFTERGTLQQTKAVLDKTLRIDYWTKNKNEFKYLRDSLGLSPTNF